MQNTVCLVISLMVLLAGLTSCSKQENTAQYRLPGIETSINRIQRNPLAHDRALVTFRGIVADISESELNEGIRSIILSDPSGITQRLIYSGDADELERGDIVVISGIYDRSSDTIDADHIIKIQMKENKQ